MFDVLACAAAFGEAQSADHFKVLLASSSNVLIQSGELMLKLKLVVDHMIELELFKPTAKFKKIAGLDTSEESKVDTHPFSGFMCSVVCLTCNITYLKN